MCFSHCHTVTDYKTYNIQKPDILHRGIRQAFRVRLLGGQKEKWGNTQRQQLNLGGQILV